MKLLLPSRKYKLSLKRLSLCVIFLSVISGGYFFCMLFKKHFKELFSCSLEEAEHAVNVICKSYFQNDALGNMCQSLCLTGDLQLLGCMEQHSGKEVVFKAKWKNVTVVMKALHLDHEKYDQIYWTDKSQKKYYPNLTNYYKMLNESIFNTVNYLFLGKRENIIDKVWTLNQKYFTSLPTELMNTAMNNIWHLIQQPEYCLSVLYDSYNVFPRILGSCGHIFAVECLAPLTTYFSVLHPSWKFDFSQRAKWALKLLKMVSKLESKFESLHLCDMKIGHVGLTDDNQEMKFLDLDMVFTDNALARNLGINICENGCNFIDCQGECDSEHGYCKEKVIDSNLQRICKNIFLGHSTPNIFGLLSLPPNNIADELDYLLNECIRNTTTSSAKLIERLKSILQASLLSS